MAAIVKIERIGVPCGLFMKRVEAGYVLENGIVLLEAEKDQQDRYIGGAGMDGIYLRTPERYLPILGGDGKALAFQRINPGLAP